MLPPLAFATSLLAYCTATGGSVTSWGRTPIHNAKVGGVPTSYHLTWQAADVVYDAPIPITRRQIHAKHLGLELTPEDDHDHLEPLG